ncbi:hypothetical protein HZC53_04890 [Candidatus Uhrbacteria bacterium]|nr:hypothetical protein [Candidatus Uhrbacteria bacterium]
MFQMFCVFVMESGPRCFQYVSDDCVSFHRVGVDCMYVAPGAIKLVDDDIILSAGEGMIGKLDTWVSSLGTRVFFTDDLPTAVAATQALRDEIAARAA